MRFQRVYAPPKSPMQKTFYFIGLTVTALFLQSAFSGNLWRFQWNSLTWRLPPAPQPPPHLPAKSHFRLYSFWSLDASKVERETVLLPRSWHVSQKTFIFHRRRAFLFRKIKRSSLAIRNSSKAFPNRRGRGGGAKILVRCPKKISHPQRDGVK